MHRQQTLRRIGHSSPSTGNLFIKQAKKSGKNSNKWTNTGYNTESEFKACTSFPLPTGKQQNPLSYTAKENERRINTKCVPYYKPE